MNIIKLKTGDEIQREYIGIIEWENGNKSWYKNCKPHREDGSAIIYKNGYKSWWLDGKVIWNSNKKLNLTNQIILSKTQHPEYPTVQVWKIFDKDRVYEQIVIPGMEEFIIE